MTNILNDLSDKAYQHAVDKGFINSESFPYQMFRQLERLHSEVSELGEAFVKGVLTQQCDKKVELTNAEEEVADILIRTLCLAGYLKESGLISRDIDIIVERKMLYNTTRPERHGKQF